MNEAEATVKVLDHIGRCVMHELWEVPRAKRPGWAATFLIMKVGDEFQIEMDMYGGLELLEKIAQDPVTANLLAEPME